MPNRYMGFLKLSNLFLVLFLSLVLCPAFAITTVGVNCSKDTAFGGNYTCNVNNCSSGIFIIKNSVGSPINITEMVLEGDFPVTFFESYNYTRQFRVDSEGDIKVEVICLDYSNLAVKRQSLYVSQVETDGCFSCSSNQVSSSCSNGVCTIACDGVPSGTISCPNGVSQNSANGVSRVCCTQLQA